MKNIINSSAGILATRVVGIGLGLSTTIVLSRLLSIETFGQFSYFYSLGMAISAFAHLGIPTLITREFARISLSPNRSNYINLLRWAGLRLSLGAIVVSAMLLFVCFISWEIQTGGVTVDRQAALLITAFVTVFVLLQSQRGAVNGLGKPFAASIPDEVLRQGAFLLAILICSGAFILSADQLMLILIGAVSGSASIYILMIVIALQKVKANKNETLEINNEQLSKDMWRLLFASVMFASLTYADILIVGFFMGAEEVGSYRIATQIAVFASLLMMAIQEGGKPHIAKNYASRRISELKDISIYGARAQTLFSFVFLVFFFFWGDESISLVFGHQYEGAYAVVLLLVTLRTISMGFGLGDITLKMSDYPSLSFWFTLMAAILNIALNIILVPELGLVGAAISTGCAWLLLSILCWTGILMKIGYRGDAFATPRKTIRAGFAG